MISGSVSLLCSRFFSPFPHGTGSLSVSRKYLALRDGPRWFTLNFSCSALLRCRLKATAGFGYGAFTRCGPPFQKVPLPFVAPLLTVLQPPLVRRHTAGLGSCAFARHYLRNHFCFLFLRLLRCFSSPGSLRTKRAVTESLPPGCPIRKSAHQWVFAPPRGLSQLVTSFFAFESLGILHVPFSPFLLSLYAWRFTRRRSDSSLRFYRLLCYSFSLLEFCFHHVNVLCVL